MSRRPSLSLHVLCLTLTFVLLPFLHANEFGCSSHAPRKDPAEELKETFDSFDLPHFHRRNVWLSLAADVLFGGFSCKLEGLVRNCTKQPDSTCDQLLNDVVGIPPAQANSRHRRDAPVLPQQQQQQRRDHQRFTQQHEQQLLQQELRPKSRQRQQQRHQQRRRKKQPQPDSALVDVFHWLPPHPQTSLWLEQDRMSRQTAQSGFVPQDNMASNARIRPAHRTRKRPDHQGRPPFFQPARTDERNREYEAQNTRNQSRFQTTPSDEDFGQEDNGLIGSTGTPVNHGDEQHSLATDYFAGNEEDSLGPWILLPSTREIYPTDAWTDTTAASHTMVNIPVTAEVIVPSQIEQTSSEDEINVTPNPATTQQDVSADTPNIGTTTVNEGDTQKPPTDTSERHDRYEEEFLSSEENTTADMLNARANHTTPTVPSTETKPIENMPVLTTEHHPTDKQERLLHKEGNHADTTVLNIEQRPTNSLPVLVTTTHEPTDKNEGNHTQVTYTSVEEETTERLPYLETEHDKTDKKDVSTVPNAKSTESEHGDLLPELHSAEGQQTTHNGYLLTRPNMTVQHASAASRTNDPATKRNSDRGGSQPHGQNHGSSTVFSLGGSVTEKPGDLNKLLSEDRGDDGEDYIDFAGNRVLDHHFTGTDAPPQQGLISNTFDPNSDKHYKKKTASTVDPLKPTGGNVEAVLHPNSPKPPHLKPGKYTDRKTSPTPTPSSGHSRQTTTHNRGSGGTHSNNNSPLLHFHGEELTDFNTSNFTTFAVRVLFAALRMKAKDCIEEYPYPHKWVEVKCHMYARVRGSRGALQTITFTLEKHLSELLGRWNLSRVAIRPQNDVGEVLVQQQMCFSLRQLMSIAKEKLHGITPDSCHGYLAQFLGHLATSLVSRLLRGQRIEPDGAPCPADFADELFRTFGVRQPTCAEGHVITLEGLDLLLDSTRKSGCESRQNTDAVTPRSLWPWQPWSSRSNYEPPRSIHKRFSARELANIVLVGSNNYSSEQPLNAQQFYQLCPSLLQQLLLAPGQAAVEQSMDDDMSTEIQTELSGVEEIPQATAIQSYGLGTAAVTAITMCSLMAAVTVKMCHSASQHYAMAAMLALAIGSLCGDAVLHLLPQGLQVNESNTSSKIYQLPGEVSVCHSRLKALAILASIYLLFLLELLTTRRRLGHSHGPSDKQETAFKLTSQTSSCDTPMTSIREMQESRPYETVLASPTAQAQHKEPALTIEAAEFEATSMDLVWMIMVGDAAHNIADGLAIGASFAHNVPLGLSTSIAVVCHEIPHELGDFAVLLSTGLSLKRALLLNLLSSLLEFVGLYVGLAIGAGIEARQWMFLIVAGMFSYISLANLIPELVRYFRHFRNPKMFVLQQLGILSGFAIMFSLVMLESKIHL